MDWKFDGFQSFKRSFAYFSKESSELPEAK